MHYHAMEANAIIMPWNRCPGTGEIFFLRFGLEFRYCCLSRGRINKKRDPAGSRIGAWCKIHYLYTLVPHQSDRIDVHFDPSRTTIPGNAFALYGKQHWITLAR